MAAPRVGVVGHVEWVQFAVVDRYPGAGEIVLASHWFEEAAGGGAVAAAQLRKLAGTASFLTAVGDDDLGRRAHDELAGRHGLDVHAARIARPHRRVFCHLDGAAERTITVLGGRMAPAGADDLPWDGLRTFDGIYFTGGDAEALWRARAAKVLVATPRVLSTIVESGVELDVLVGSANDPGEAVDLARLPKRPRHVVLTSGAKGGSWAGADGATGAWAACELPGPPVDSYGAGDSFAAGLTYGLAAGMPLEEALELAARCGAWCLTGRGPYGNQLTLTA